MSRHDQDGDGEVSLEEFDGPRRRFRHLDRNQDGVIDREEVSAGRPPHRRPMGEGRPDKPPPSRPRQQEGMEVITVGTGSPLYNPDRSGPCTLIRNGSQYVLVDMGEGTSRHLREAEIAIGRMAAFCFTHHHRDHNDDAMTILPRAWVRGVAAPVIGPTGTRRLCDFLWSFYEEDMQYRAGNRGGSAGALTRPEVVELPQREPLSIAGMKVTTTQVDHTITTFAYRFEAEGKVIVVSGDLTYSESLIELAQDADILVMDSGGVVYSETRDGRPRAGERRREGGRGTGRGGRRERGRNGVGGGAGAPGRKPQVAHASLEEVARMAAGARVKKLVLTHFRPGTVDEEETRRRLSEIYAGEILFGEDMKAYR
ncbi:MAG: MBL fold metallo-hydrolase [bacterium]|nr:MBL fold metallo-hydrolase [bacterium]